MQMQIHTRTKMRRGLGAYEINNVVVVDVSERKKHMEQLETTDEIHKCADSWL